MPPGLSKDQADALYDRLEGPVWYLRRFSLRLRQRGFSESDRLCVRTRTALRAAEELLNFVGFLAGRKHKRMKWMPPLLPPRAAERSGPETR
jgi:hypothetical protein